MIHLNPTYMTPPKFSVSNFNLLTIVRRPYWVISGYIFNVLVCVIFANAAHAAPASIVAGTYIAMYFDGDYLVIGGDSRGTQLELNSSSDNVCKIIPLSKQVIFFAIGITVDRGFNARDIAQNIERFVGNDEKIKDMGDQWGGYMVQAFEKESVSHASTLIDHQNKRGNLVGGFFTTMASGNLAMYGVTVKIMDDPTVVPMKLGISGEAIIPRQGISYFGSNVAASREFIRNNTAPVPPVGIDKAGAYIEALVEFVERTSGDLTVGGPVTIITLDDKKGANWFRRPEFCPKE